MESTTMSYEANCNQVEGCVKKEKSPMEDLFGAITGLTIWNIIRMGLFPDAWWAILISVILGFGIFGNIIHALSHIKEILKYQYKSKPQDIVGHIIGLIVVNIIFGIFFMGQWWAQIPIAAVGIGLVKVLVENFINFTHGTIAPAQSTYAPTPAQPTYAPAPTQPTYAPTPAQPTYAPTPAQPTYAPAPAQPTYAPTPAQPVYNPVMHQPGASQPMMGQPAVLEPVYHHKEVINCPNCGFDKADGVKFCPACGYKF
jgi:hypothetical protein